MADEEVAKPASLSPEVQSEIGNRLKRMYDQIVHQPVPDRFKDLLAELDKAKAPKAQ